MNESQEGKFFNLDHRHLAFFFLAAVGVCAVFFSLGYVVGRAHSSGPSARDPWSENVSSYTQSAPESSRSVDSTSRENRSVPESPVGPTVKRSEESGASSGELQPELEFYKAVKEPKVNESFHSDTVTEKKAGKSKHEVSAENKAATDAKPTAEAYRSGSSFSLQVAALKSAREAEKLAKSLRSKGYQVYVIHPGKDEADKLIRVQVGPYNSESETNTNKKKLESAGYKTIIKRQ